jgi:membrane-associated phospholipid phosphatase
LFHINQSQVIRIGILKLVMLLLIVFSFGILTPVAAQDDVAAWPTWVLESGDQFRLDAPPDEAATTGEISQLLAMVAERDAAGLQQIAYWNAGPPSYRWNQIAMDELLQRAIPAQMSFRDLALLNVAIYDATVAAWDSKFVHNRPRPSEVDPSLATVIPNPTNPSYPSDYAVTAGAASTILAWLFPEEAEFFQAKAQEAVNSRLLAGVEYPSDVEAGLELGRQVAELVIERGTADGTDAEWTGTVPTETTGWTGENPSFPLAGTWKTWVLESGDQFRPEPPPAYDSEQLATEMAELVNYERTPVSSAKAMFWEFGAGGRRIHWFWNDIASRLILESNLENEPLEGARAYALTNIAGYEAAVATWDAKYTYWAIRPFQLDSEFKPLFTTPNHPAYPSAHTTMSVSTAGVLAYLFPYAAEEVLALAEEASESRIWGGIHFRSDLVAGKELGQNVANAIITYVEPPKIASIANSFYLQ